MKLMIWASVIKTASNYLYKCRLLQYEYKWIHFWAAFYVTWKHLNNKTYMPLSWELSVIIQELFAIWRSETVGVGIDSIAFLYYISW